LNPSVVHGTFGRQLGGSGLLPNGTHTMTYQVTRSQPVSILGRQARGELRTNGSNLGFNFPAHPGDRRPRSTEPAVQPDARVPSVTDLVACPGLTSRVPEALVVAALANPKRIRHFGETCRPVEAPGPTNPLKTWLRLENQDKPYDPVFNGLVFGCICR
jgi:hypothetical protein